MTREEMLEEIQELPEGTHIFIRADHGQDYEAAMSIELMSADEASYHDIEIGVDEAAAIIYGW